MRCRTLHVLVGVLGLLLISGVSAAGAAAPLPHYRLGLKAKAPPARRNFNAHQGWLSSLPDHADLTPWAMPPGDQGAVGSCAAWAVGYTAMGYYENHDGIPTPGGGEAMYIYSQTHVGGDGGSYFADDFNIAVTQGVDNRDDYWQGDFDWWDLPNPAETAHAANWKLTGFTTLSLDRYTIENALANGHPVAIGIPVTEAFETNTTGLYPDPTNPDDDVTVLGYHGITALGYDQTGLMIENSWGPAWDDRGYVRIRWEWLASHLSEAYDVGPAHGLAPPVDIAPPQIGGRARVGETLEELQGVWTNEPTAYMYQWQRENRTGTHFVNIRGATSKTYRVAARDAGSRIRVEEWATNGSGTAGPAVSRPTKIVHQ